MSKITDKKHDSSSNSLNQRTAYVDKNPLYS